MYLLIAHFAFSYLNYLFTMFLYTIHCLKGPVQIVNPSYRDSPFSHVVSGLLFNEFDLHSGSTSIDIMDPCHSAVGTITLVLWSCWLLWEALGASSLYFFCWQSTFVTFLCSHTGAGKFSCLLRSDHPQGTSPPRLYENRCLPILFIFEGLWICTPQLPPLLFWAMSIIWGNSLGGFPLNQFVYLTHVYNKAKQSLCAVYTKYNSSCKIKIQPAYLNWGKWNCVP